MIPDKVFNDFYTGKRSNKIQYCINDAVEILTGTFRGKICAVVSIEQIDPEVEYLLERGDNGSMITETQINLRLIEN